MDPPQQRFRRDQVVVPLPGPANPSHLRNRVGAQGQGRIESAKDSEFLKDFQGCIGPGLAEQKLNLAKEAIPGKSLEHVFLQDVSNLPSVPAAEAKAIPGGIPGSPEDPGRVIPVTSLVEDAQQTSLQVPEPVEGIE